ncbi:DUF2116 family Zn-ribbon domain-containing protein [Raoultella ornithinolytica]|uniref:DUF2116 family Zn-ribbon domain-containing protein n=1 Tax=Raoultella ornithinolytica TaxID=54291 RepID=UPI003A9719E2
MNTHLRPCVDCGKELSRTATSCNQCQSSDPFGKKRRARKRESIFMIIILVALVFWLYETGSITEMITQFHSLYNKVTQGY